MMFKSVVFPEPEARLTPAAKCPGLDGRKMSKSYGNGIFLQDTMEEIAPKVRGMFTDPARLRKSDPGNPDVCNLYPYHELLTDPETRAEIREGCTTAKLGCVDCKKIFMKNLEAFLAPLHERRAKYVERPELVDDYLRDHLLTWAPHYLEVLEGATTHPFYRGLAQLTRASLEGLGAARELSVTLPRFYR